MVEEADRNGTRVPLARAFARLEKRFEVRKAKIAKMRALIAEADRDPRPDMTAEEVLAIVRRGVGRRRKR